MVEGYLRFPTTDGCGGRLFVSAGTLFTRGATGPMFLASLAILIDERVVMSEDGKTILLLSWYGISQLLIAGLSHS